jgi:Skp family chaperone for outer membrane proteins
LEKKCLDEILEAVKDYGRKQKCGMIFDSRVVLYGPEGTDITDEIIKALNK